MICRPLAIILTFCLLGSITAIAGFSRANDLPDSGHLEDLLGAPAEPTFVRLGQAYNPNTLQPMTAADKEYQVPKYIHYNGLYLTKEEFAESFLGTSPALWIESTIGWSWSSTLPLGYKARGLLYLPRGGSLRSYEIYPSGVIKTYDLGWVRYGYGYAWFEGDEIGRHLIIFTINGVPSNAIIVDVLQH